MPAKRKPSQAAQIEGETIDTIAVAVLQQRIAAARRFMRRCPYGRPARRGCCACAVCPLVIDD